MADSKSLGGALPVAWIAATPVEGKTCYTRESTRERSLHPVVSEFVAAATPVLAGVKVSSIHARAWRALGNRRESGECLTCGASAQSAIAPLKSGRGGGTKR